MVQINIKRRRRLYNEVKINPISNVKEHLMTLSRCSLFDKEEKKNTQKERKTN